MISKNIHKMKKIALLFLFSCAFLNMFSQSVSFSKEDITGRWTEVKEGDIPKQYTEKEYPYIYIFKDDNVFHLGEASDGVILFNITGKYTIESNTINVIYFDFLRSNAQSRKAKSISFKVISINDDIMTLLATDYDYSYSVILRRQKAE